MDDQVGENTSAETAQPGTNAEPVQPRHDEAVAGTSSLAIAPKPRKSKTAAKATPSTKAKAQATGSNSGKRGRSTRPFPAVPFEEAFAFAKEIYDFGSGQQVRRLSL